MDKPETIITGRTVRATPLPFADDEVSLHHATSVVRRYLRSGEQRDQSARDRLRVAMMVLKANEGPLTTDEASQILASRLLEQLAT